LGQPVRIGLPNENAGLIPTPAWKEKHLKQQWFPGETISLSIGGGMLNLTPSQILKMISTVALRGKAPRLHLLKRIEKGREIIRKTEPEFQQIAIEPRYFETVIQGLYQVVNDEGTGRAARVTGMDICGKTGTQQIISKENPGYKELVKQKRFRPHSWFASFAPRLNPRFAVVVFVEHGGDAGEVAAPIAAAIYKKLLKP
jgi:penicillin-binding protein 2